MGSWLDTLIRNIIDSTVQAMSTLISSMGQQVSISIWDVLLQWLYETIFGAIADFFSGMGNMGADLFELDWVQAVIQLFTLFGWSLFIAGLVVVFGIWRGVSRRRK